MKTLKTSLMVGVAAASFGAVALPSQAAAAETDEAPIIVTARRTEERLQDVPISITVFNQEAINNRNVITASDLAVYTPSLSINQRFGPEKAAFQIRGFNQDNSTAPTVGAYFADVVAPRAQGGTAGGGIPLTGSFMDLQNVQVLKGPQGTLFGRNTTGGAVLLVPTKPTDKLEGYVEGSVGDYNMWRFQGVLNVPLSDTFKVRFAVDRNNRKGYMKNHSGIGTDNYNDVGYFYGRVSVLWEPSADLENYTIFHYSDSNTNNYGARIVACNPNLQSFATAGFVTGGSIFTAQPACDQLARQKARGDGPLDVEIDNPDPYLSIKQWQAINTTTWQASDSLTIKNIISFSEYRERGNFSLDGDNFTTDFGAYNDLYPLGLFPYAPGQKFQYILLNGQPTGHQASQKTFTEELQFQGNTGRLKWQAGGYMEISRPIGFNQSYTGILLDCQSPENLQCYNLFGVGQVSGAATKFSFDNYGLYAQGTFDITDQLSLTAGIRYTWDKTSAFSESVRVSPPPNAAMANVLTCNDIVHFNNGFGPDGRLIPVVVTDRSQCYYAPPDEKSSKPTWVIDLEYKPNSDIMVFAKWARGYRAGGLNLTTVGYEGWGPESVDDYEAGAKFTFNGAVRGYFNVTGFYNDFRNMQIQVTGVSNTPGFSGAVPEVNAGKARIWGIEADASISPLEGLKFDLGYTYLNTKLLSIDVPPIPPGAPYSAFIPTAVVGGPLAQSPKNRISLTGTYTLPLDPSIGEISIGATFIHTDKQIFTQATLNPSDPLYTTPGALPPVLASFIDSPADIRVQPATNILNFNVNWTDVMGRPFDLAFFMTNVTNEVYPIGVGQSWNSAGFENLLYSPPRMFGFRLKWRFGE